jgi:hypothetical protein
MADDELFETWTAGGGMPHEQVRRAVDAALAEDTATRARGRRARRAALGCAAVLWAILLWSAAHGITPLVRGGYALMAAGVAVMLFAESAYASWTQQARPGLSDALTQLATTAAMLRRQATLMRTAAAWCAPIFIGGGLIGWWLYTERSHAGGVALWLIVAAGWLLSVVGGRSRGRDLDRRRARLEQLLGDLRS